MAEEDSELELERFQQELESLLNASVEDEHGLQSKFYCVKFCELVEEYTGRWQVPLPQLQVLRSALCAFVHGTASFPSDCEHVRYTLGSLALSIFELLLFFGRDEFPEDPLKDILDSFQECHSSLVRYQNVYLLQVKHIIRDGGPWASPVLEGILKELEQPQDEVDRYLSSEVPLFFELRVRYLLACERTHEAMALSQRCSQHPTAGRHIYFKQAYLACLWKTSQQDRLFTEMAEIDGKEAVEILCIAELEEKDSLLLELSRGFLLQHLRSGDMYHIWDLVFIWCKVYLRLKSSKKDFLEECKHLIMSATNVKAIFPFIKAILAEQMGKEGLTFCIELCAWALETDLKNDPVTKSLIYKSIAYLFPNDLEICRACALLVFFLECTVEAYKTVFRLYNHPDLEYHPDSSPVRNNIRFEVVQMLKKGLFFDPEFWSLLHIKTNCLKLMSDEVARDALFEIMKEDKWASNYCVRKNCVCRPEPDRTGVRDEAKPANGVRKESETSKRVKASSDHSQSDTYQTRMRKRVQITEEVRRLRQSDSAQNHAGQMNNRLLTRQAEKILLKRRGRRPRWLLEQLAAQGVADVPREGKKPGRKPKQKVEAVIEDTPIIEITLEYSYPDNEVDIPANIQFQTTTKNISTEDKLDDQKNPAPPSNVTPNSLLQLFLEESTQTSSEKDKVTEKFPSLDVSVIRQFHAYAIVPVNERTSLNSSTVSVVKTPREVEPEIPMEIPMLVKKSSEPLKVYSAKTKASSMTGAIPQEISGQSVLKRHPDPKLSSISTSEQAVVADKVDNTVKSTDSCTDKSTGQSDSTHTAKNVQERISNPLVNACDKRTDHISPNKSGSDMNSTSGNVLQTTTKTTPKTAQEKTANTIPILKKVTESDEIPLRKISTNIPAVKSVKEVKPKQSQDVADRTIEHKSPPDRPSMNNGPAPVQKELVHRCKLCNEECRNSEILNHALWHYRTEKMCMFCPNFTNSSGALCHFKKHVKDLKNADVPLEAKKPEDVIAPTEKPDQTVPALMQKKPKPGFAQIKSKLLMRIQLKSKASITTQQDSDKRFNSDEKSLTHKEDQAVRKSPLPQEPKKGCRADERRVEESSSLEKKRTYFTRGLVKKSESKQKMLRMRLARKAKSGSTKADGNRSAPKDASVHRKNGVIRKKRKIKNKDASHAADKTAQPVHAEPTKQKAEKIKDDHNETKQDKEGSNSVEEQNSNCYKSDAKPKENKRKSSEQKQDVKAGKKRKVLAVPSEGRGANQNPSEQETDTRNAIKQDSLTRDFNEISDPVPSKSSRIHSVIKCPIEMCTFQARLNPIHAHVLSNHPGDMKALEFLYHLSQKKCAFCTQRICTPRHFCDHVVRHRGHLRHPCYDVDCKLRFKTRPELSEHMQSDHCPLKAVCSFPKCTVQFDCLKLLYDHEKNHYKMAWENASWEKDTSVDQQIQSVDGTERRNSTTPSKLEEENPSTNPKLVNGHSNHEQEMSSTAQPTPVKEDTKTPLVAVKPFSRPPPSAYLDELYLTMPKRWKGPQVSPKGSETSSSSPSKKHRCSRCSAAFDSEVELQQHRSKCTSLFGFDSDDENSF
ncbi:uncharacterized protein znf654 [Trichomycterus rosablanca]|uniref:uncharacterized protein znf654 n=1 Tax=Trichomycterus rosablanca TaxID=2290929 RepID=UPI002F35C00D